MRASSGMSPRRSLPAVAIGGGPRPSRKSSLALPCRLLGQKISARVPTRWTCGLIQAPATWPFAPSIRTSIGPPTFTSKVPTSIAVGSSLPSGPPSLSRARRLIAPSSRMVSSSTRSVRRFRSPITRAESRRPLMTTSRNTAPISCASGSPRKTTRAISRFPMPSSRPFRISIAGCVIRCATSSVISSTSMPRRMRSQSRS